MYGKSENADDYQYIPRPVGALAVDFPDRHRVPRHDHPRAQLIYSATGVVVVNTDGGTWVVPPLRAVWMPAGTGHWLRLIGRCAMRTLYLAARAVPGAPRVPAVVEVSPLLRELIGEAVRVPILYDRRGRDGMVMSLLLREIRIAPVPALHLPMPTDPRLGRVCEAILREPASARTLDEWAGKSAMSGKTLARLFLGETRMTFGRWRQQARLLASLPRLAGGEAVLSVAMDLGYGSPSAFTAMFRKALGTTPSRYFHPDDSRDGRKNSGETLRGGRRS